MAPDPHITDGLCFACPQLLLEIPGVSSMRGDTIIFLLLAAGAVMVALSKYRSRRLVPKERPDRGRQRRQIARKSRFKLFDNPLKPYKLPPTESIRRKAEECRARQIAAENPAELQFATILRQAGLHPLQIRDPGDIRGFRYQVIFYRVGSFIVVDFVCDHQGIVFEIDGRASHESQKGYDAGRDRWLLTQGFRTVRITATDVFRKRPYVLCRVKAELKL
jgi:very-short-patch-repair endonuclease